MALISTLESLIVDLTSVASRILVTLLFVVAIVLLAREVYRLWARPPLTLGEVQYFDGSTADEAKAKNLAAEAIDRHNATRASILRLVAASKGQRDAEDGPQKALDYGKFFPEELVALDEAAKGTPEIQLNIQGNDIGAAITAIYRWVQPRNTAGLAAFKRENGTELVIEWPETPEQETDQNMASAVRSVVWDDSKIGHAAGCRLLWMKLAAEANVVGRTDPEVFCRWAEARLNLDVAEAEKAATRRIEQSRASAEASRDSIREISETVGGFPPLQSTYALLLGHTDPAAEKKIAHAWANVGRVLDGEEPTVFDEEAASVEAALPLVGIRPGQVFDIGTMGNFVQVRSPVTVERDGEFFLVFPDYVFSADRSDQVFTRQASDGKEELVPVGRRVTQPNRFYIALVKLENVDASNSVDGLTIERTTATAPGDKVRMIGNEGITEGTVRQVAVSERLGDRTVSSLVRTTRLTKIRGQGGAPVLDEDDGLVGMLYASGEDTSYVLPLDEAFRELGLTIID